jgi:cysteine desulfurase
MDTPAARRRPIYLDHHATTPVDPRVAQVVMHAMLSTFGNANSVDHAYGEEARELVARSREEVAALVGAEPEAVHFTSGSSEALALALQVVLREAARPITVVVPRTEHRALLGELGRLESVERVRLRWLDVDENARLRLDELDRALDGADLVCAMAANNEVGTVHPTEEIVRRVHASGARLLVDATQAAGRVPLRMGEWGIDFLALTAHKIYGPKGVGALLTSPDWAVREEPTTPGTGPGTPNVPGIAGFGEASRLRRLEGAEDERRIGRLRDRLQARLEVELPDLRINGDVASRLAGNLHLSVAGVPGDAVIARLRSDVAISTGAACTSGTPEASHVLRAMGLGDEWLDGALRIGLGRGTQPEDVEEAADRIISAVQGARRAVAGVPSRAS